MTIVPPAYGSGASSEWARDITDAVNLLTGASHTVATEQSTFSSGYVNLTTPGPVLTLATGTLVRVAIAAYSKVGFGLSSTAAMTIEVTGATSLAASLEIIVATTFETTYDLITAEGVIPVTAGANTFTVKYRNQNGAQAIFKDRLLYVARLN